MIYLCVSVQLVISSSTVSAEVFYSGIFGGFTKKASGALSPPTVLE